MALGIKYSGVILGIEYPGLAAWVDDNHNLGELLDQARRSISGVSMRREARGDRPNDVSLTQPNWAGPPGVTPNSLYWPTGATRWATFYALVDTATKDEILDAQGGEGSAPTEKPLVIQDDNVTLTTDMWMLSPRPITAHTKQKLWLIPLVDDRWRWQWRDSSNLAVTSATTWTDMFNDMATALGISIDVGTINSDYFIPDLTELTRRYENAALILDAVAQSVGLRIVRRLDGTVKAISAADSGTDLDDEIPIQVAGGAFEVNDANLVPHIAGGDYSDIHRGMNYPQSLHVTFPHYDDSTIPGVIIFADNLFMKSESLGNYVSGVTPISATEHTIHTTARADFGGGNPINFSNVVDLSAAIAADYFAWLRRHYDITWSGIKTWKPTGFCDNVEWFAGSMRPDGSRQVQTRVQSVPHNFGFQEQLSQFSTTISHERDGICSSIWSS